MEEQKHLPFGDEFTENKEDNMPEIGLSDKFILEIQELLEAHYIDRIQELCANLDETDSAELITKIDAEDRFRLVDILEDSLKPETFSYIDHGILNKLLRHMSASHIASIINELNSDDALSLVDGLDEHRHSEIMRLISRKLRTAVEEGLSFGIDTAGRLMQREYIAIPQFWTIGKTVDYLRAARDNLPDKFYNIFIVDPLHKLVGYISLSDVLRSQRSMKMQDIMHEEVSTIPLDMDQEHVAHLFRRKDLLSAPVVDDHNRLMGIITVDDIVDVIDQEAEEDLLKLGGVSDSDIYSSTLHTARARFVWLFVNLFTALIAAYTISLFEGTIQKIVILAALMPIVTSIGGNAGIQTLAVAVRALATKKLSAANAWRVTAKEFAVGSINGVLFALILGSITWYWYDDAVLGLVIGSAMIVNLIAAGLCGILIPLAIDRLGLDPAMSATVFLTTVTDVIGFGTFLGLATIFLL